MKNVLAIEIKDNKTIVTLAKVQDGDYSLLLHKSYGSKALATHVYYDSEIIDKINTDLREINILNDIDEKYLTINTNRVIVSSEDFEYKYNTDLDTKKMEYVQNLERTNPTVSINHIVFSNEEGVALTKQNIRATFEATTSDYINDIKNQYRAKGIEFTKIIPVMRSIQNSVISESGDEDITISVLVEEKFTQLTLIERGMVTSSIKWDTGLTNIYQHISSIMNISKSDAKQLFKSFGSIPPEDVVDDKVIHTRRYGKEMEVFTKKDLSRYITEKVQELFANVKYHIDTLKTHDNQIKIVFNGEIKTLMGFRKFASRSFNEPNIKKFKTNIIGLNPETEFITMGILLEVKEDLDTRQRKEHLYTPKTNLLGKLFRMYNYI